MTKNKERFSAIVAVLSLVKTPTARNSYTNRILYFSASSAPLRELLFFALAILRTKGGL